MGPIEAFTTAWRKSFTYGGKATRAEYWWFYLLDLVIYFALLSVFSATVDTTDSLCVYAHSDYLLESLRYFQLSPLLFVGFVMWAKNGLGYS